jgi:DNA-directed RNA polymerase specialized sigma24 family protein
MAVQRDLSEVPLETLKAATVSAKERWEQLEFLTGRLIVQLNERGMRFTEIGELLEIPHSTAHYWAKKARQKT